MNISLNFKIGFGKNSKPSNCTTFIKQSESAIKDFDTVRRYSTVKNYHTALNSFTEYVKEKNFWKQDFSGMIISEYEGWLLSRLICRNTIANYMRYLRALYNIINNGCTNSPFGCVSTSNAITSKRSLCLEDIRKLLQLQSSLPPSLAMYLDVFLFSVYTFGIPFVDLVRLRHSDIINDVITYNRRKTHKPVVVVLLPQAAKIISKYADESSDYLFPFISDEISCSYQKYQQLLAKYNRALSDIGRIARVKGPLTSYVARHTWASIAFANGVDVGIISQALGHTNLRTTQIYLHELNAERMRQAGQRVISVL